MASKTWKWLTHVDGYLSQKFPGEIPRRILEEFIWQEFGADERTVIKYLKVMERVGLVRMKNPHVYEYCGLKLESRIL